MPLPWNRFAVVSEGYRSLTPILRSLSSRMESFTDLQHAGVEDLAHLRRARIRDIQVVRSLGSGAFAQVHLVTIPVDGRLKLCARKLLNTAQTPAAEVAALPSSSLQVKPSTAADMQRERQMHQLCSGCPFIVELLAAKTGASSTSLLMQFAEHGSLAQAYQLLAPEDAQDQQHSCTCAPDRPPSDLYSSSSNQQQQQQQQQQRPQPSPHCRTGACKLLPLPQQLVVGAVAGMPEAVARFYVACVVLALEHLHALSIVHRDVKPQNVLLYGNGYAKLGDLGCCVQLPPGQLAHTRSGTAAYLAPEVVTQLPYGTAADMWSLGVTLLHLLEGQVPPWCQAATPAPSLLPASPSFPPTYSQELVCLLHTLLSTDAAARPTAVSIQNASWFQGFPWQQLRDETLAAPPVLVSAS